MLPQLQAWPTASIFVTLTKPKRFLTDSALANLVVNSLVSPAPISNSSADTGTALLTVVSFSVNGTITQVQPDSATANLQTDSLVAASTVAQNQTDSANADLAVTSLTANGTVTSTINETATASLAVESFSA